MTNTKMKRHPKEEVIRAARKVEAKKIADVDRGEPYQVLAPETPRRLLPYEAQRTIRFCFTGLVGDGGYHVSKCYEGEPGHEPAFQFGFFSSLEKAQKKADDLNEKLGLDKVTALKIVGSTMGPQSRFHEVLEKIVKLKGKVEATDDLYEEDVEDLFETAEHLLKVLP